LVPDATAIIVSRTSPYPGCSAAVGQRAQSHISTNSPTSATARTPTDPGNAGWAGRPAAFRECTYRHGRGHSAKASSQE
jgi:hypothetical protein